MALSAYLAILLGQQAVATAPPVHVDTDVTKPLSVAEPIRLAVTPHLDGQIEPEEWDAFTSAPEYKTYLQWEPGKLFVGGTVPKDFDLVLSLDTKDDGWLKGTDNVEVRASLVEGKVVIKAAQLDTTGKNGPVWSDLPGVVLGSEGVARSTDADTTFELSISDALGAAFKVSPGKKLGLRLDVIPTGEASPAPYVPRVMSDITFETTRSAGMPKGLRVKIEDGFQTVTIGESIKTRVGFNGTNALQLQKLDLRSEGYAKDYTATMSVPFPTFDNKGRAFVDYKTKVAAGATYGYRILCGTVTAGDGLPAVVQTSYRIAPLVDFFLRKDTIKGSDVKQVVKVLYGVRSNSFSRVLGGVSATLPTGWRNLTMEDKGFIIHRKGFVADRSLDVEIPGDAVGTFPIVLRSVLGDQVTEQTVFLTVTH